MAKITYHHYHPQLTKVIYHVSIEQEYESAKEGGEPSWGAACKWNWLLLKVPGDTMKMLRIAKKCFMFKAAWR